MRRYTVERPGQDPETIDADSCEVCSSGALVFTRDEDGAIVRAIAHRQWTDVKESNVEA